MEGREAMTSDAPSDHLVPKTVQNPNQIGGSSTIATSMSIALEGRSGNMHYGDEKKKRGRPRKYGPDGAVSFPLSAMPISYSAPEKRGRGRPVGSLNRPQKKKVEVMENLGDWVSCPVGANFMPHVITVAAGEDVTMKIISFSQQGPRAICVLSANGVISNVTLRQPYSSGGTLTYEGRFEIISLSGSFMPSESGGPRSRAGGLSVSLASPDGRVVGGGVAGLLVAATPVQVVVGSFLPCTQQEQKPKKPKHEPTLPAAPTLPVYVSTVGMQESHSGQVQQCSTIPKPNLTDDASVQQENRDPSDQHSRNLVTDINIPLTED